MSVPAFNLKLTLSSGPLLVAGANLYYSQSNPYELRQYTLDGELRMRIFRKNSFMEPARFWHLRGGGVQFRAHTRSSRLGMWAGKVVNTEWVAPRSSAPSEAGRAVVDIFGEDGSLLASLAPRDLRMMDVAFGDGRVYVTIGRGYEDCKKARGRLTTEERR
ncbi:MAG: hypothetical protein ONB30_12340 [candidate division KSB1 bacterium]|nr:hypothetical protein [candidate division KSB1 bacterium]